ncbi:phosphatase PAP2 family protein [Streptomyces sp. NPDC053069]|uniref:phosphatase PAP2 family protein n=1 Tax=Streptomyces sp. NPDC053069 TaxID=3365695 RepID=UPI0037D860B2
MRRRRAVPRSSPANRSTRSTALPTHSTPRPRPRRTTGPPESSSFPSGHTAAAAAFTAAVWPAWPLAGMVCAVPAAAVAIERVQSGAHFPSDVAAGAWLVRHSPR